MRVTLPISSRLSLKQDQLITLSEIPGPPQTAQWDRQLNAAYQAAMKGTDPSATTPLRAAERAWLEYRKQRCYYLGAGPGTIGHVVAADCFYEMTRARAEELTNDAKGFGPG